MERCLAGGDDQREVECLYCRQQDFGPSGEVSGWTATQDVEHERRDEHRGASEQSAAEGGRIFHLHTKAQWGRSIQQRDSN